VSAPGAGRTGGRGTGEGHGVAGGSSRRGRWGVIRGGRERSGIAGGVLRPVPAVGPARSVPGPSSTRAAWSPPRPGPRRCASARGRSGAWCERGGITIG